MMRPWIIDARELDINQPVEREQILSTPAIEDFLDFDNKNKTVVAAPKGYGKTLLIKYKRHSYEDRGYLLIPQNTMVDIGPKFSGPELDKVDRMVQAAIKAGAKALTGGSRLTEGEFARGHWFEPTVLTAVDNRMPIMQDEVFGPVIPLMTVTDFDEGLRLANESRYGLSAYVFTKDMRRLMRLVRELKFGEIYVNRPGGDAVHAHHAGLRHSGIGGEDGKYGLDAYFQKKTIYVNFA